MTPATPQAAAAVALALAFACSTPAAAEDRRGEPACYGRSSEAPTENIVITALMIDRDGSSGWSGSGPVQSLFDTGPDGTPRFVSTEEEVFDLVVSLRHIGPTSGLGLFPKPIFPEPNGRYADDLSTISTTRRNPHPIRRGLCNFYSSSSEEGSFDDVLNVNVYRLGTVRGPEDEDPRRNMPPVAPDDRRGKSGCYGSSSEDAPTENIVITTALMDEDPSTVDRWSGSGPVQSLYGPEVRPDGTPSLTPRFVSTEEEVFDLVVSPRHIGPTSDLGLGLFDDPHPIRRGLCNLYFSSSKNFFGGARVLVKIYRLGTIRGPEDADPRRNMPPCANCSDDAAPLVPPP